MENEVLKAIRERRSVRSFAQREVEPDVLDAILEAGTYAPTGKGRQSPVIVAVRDGATKKMLSQMNAQARGIQTDPYYGAAVIALVLADGTVNTWIEDGSCVLENMMIAAQSLGVGSIWIHWERQMFDGEAGKALLKKWGLSETLRGVGAVALGYADQIPAPAAPRKAGYIVKV